MRDKEWLDFIKVFGVLATLFLHSNSTLVNFQTSAISHSVELNMHYWHIGVLFASLAGPSFALIFMYVGAVSLSAPTALSTRDYWNKAKLFIFPLLFWTFVSLLFQKYIMGWNITENIKSLFTLVNPISFNLWILYMLIGIFLFLPALKYLILHTTVTQQSLFLFICFLYISKSEIVPKYIQIDFTTYFYMLVGYLGYAFSGYILSKINTTKVLPYIGLFLFATGNIWIIKEVIYNSPAKDVIRGVYANQYFVRFSIPMIINTIGSFILLSQISKYLVNKQIMLRTVEHLSKIALGICMVYPYWLVFLGTEKVGIEITALSGHPLWAVPLTAFLVISGSIITIYMLQRIPYFYLVMPRIY
jgi:hypothetical protein